MKSTTKKILIFSAIILLGAALLIYAFAAITNSDSDEKETTENIQKENEIINETPNDDPVNEEADVNDSSELSEEKAPEDSAEQDNQTDVPELNEKTEEPEQTDLPTVSENNTENEENVDTEEEEEETAPPVIETITLAGSVIWNDNENQDGRRPDEISVTLYADGEESQTKAITAADEWNWSFTDLNKENNGQDIVYSIKIQAVNGYTQQIDGYNIINSHEPSKISVSGSFIWNDSNDQDGKRPAELEVGLLANGEKISTKKTSSKDSWTWTFSDLDEFQNGKKITYTISIPGISGYSTDVNGYNITNNYKPETISISGITIWDDSNNKEGKRPESIEIKILSDGKTITKEKVSKESDWCWVVSSLPKYRDGGTEIKYSVATGDIENYTTSVDGFCITNTIINIPPKTEPETEAEPDNDTTVVENEEKVDFNKEMENLLTNQKPATITMLKPEASGTLTKQNECAIIDYSNTEDGYVMVKYFEQTSNRLKVQIKGPTTTYNYDLPVNEWTVFPFSDGNGEYAIRIMKNVVDNKYSNALSVKHTVTLEDEYAPFLRPNQYVNYENAENSVNKAAELLNDKMSVLTKVKTIYSYITSNITYDYEKSYTVQSGYLPDLDKVLAQKKGICFDYASLMTGMLRSQNIPCKLVIGYADESYHAWISVWSPETGWIDNAVFFNGTNWQLMDPTFAAGGVQDFKNITYTSKYIY